MSVPAEAPLRILRLVHTLARASGGPSESVRQSSAALRAQGHTVEVATFDPAGTPSPGNFPLHALGNAGQMRTWLEANRRRFDAVLVHGLWQPHGWLARDVLRPAGSPPYFVFPHGMLDRWFRRAYPLKHAKKQAYWLWRERLVLRDAAAVFFTCAEEERLARRTFWPYTVNPRVVAYGTAEPPTEAHTPSAPFAAAFPQLSNRAFLLFLGRIHHKKGVHELLEAYAQFSRVTEAPPALVIAGPSADPQLVPTLQTAAQELGLVQGGPGEVHWLPMLDDRLKWGALRRAEAFVLLSHQENFGIAVAEALGCGTPVLISNKVNIWREIEAAGAGLVAPDTAAGGLDLLSRWQAQAPDKRATMKIAAIACFRENFEVGGAAHSLATAINQLRKS